MGLAEMRVRPNVVNVDFGSLAVSAPGAKHC